MRLATAADLYDINRWGGADFSAFLALPMNDCLIEGEGGALFAWRGPGTYEVHVFFEQRGKEVLALSHRMLDWMRAERGAKRFWSAIPVQSKHVRMFARLMGWKSHGFAVFPHGPCEVFMEETCPQL